jgi:hypothetical protein
VYHTLIEGLTMRCFKILAAIMLLAVPVLAHADTDFVPGDSTWYFHVDFDAMRDGKAGRGLYDWLDDEVFAEISEESGVDIGAEARSLTAFSAQNDGPVIVVDGKFSQTTRDQLLAMATAATGDLQVFNTDGKAYYYFEGDGTGTGDIDIDIESLEDEAYLSLALDDKIIVTHTKSQMEHLLANGGKLPAVTKSRNMLLVLRADRALIQAGANTAAMQAESENGWDSNILRNTEQFAVLLADLGDKLGLEAQLVTSQPEMANSLASIVRGLISLQVFNEEIDPELTTILQSTTVDVADNTLKVALMLDPDTVVSTLGD